MIVLVINDIYIFLNSIFLTIFPDHSDFSILH
jgi:hypothetical protein